ncbi:hypothetical protein ZWY2020_033935 [Hordeum vulgare]|nr:hypothetical protein ZWY2020_033935 [Hordeum vulgare]
MTSTPPQPSSPSSPPPMSTTSSAPTPASPSLLPSPMLGTSPSGCPCTCDPNSSSDRLRIHRQGRHHHRHQPRAPRLPRRPRQRGQCARSRSPGDSRGARGHLRRADAQHRPRDILPAVEAIRDHTRATDCFLFGSPRQRKATPSQVIVARPLLPTP